MLFSSKRGLRPASTKRGAGRRYWQLPHPRSLASVLLLAGLISLAAAWVPLDSASSVAGMVPVTSRFADVAGVYVLQRATGARPPIPFTLNVAGGTVAGTVDGARVVLTSEGTYTNDVVVRWTKAPVLPISGFEADGKPHTLQGGGSFTVDGDKIVLRPGDMFSRGVVGSIQATARASSLDLVTASGGLAGSGTRIDAHFTRVR